MQITIGKKNLDLNFGVRFVREIDKLVGVEMNIQGSKQSLGFGLTKAVLGLKSYDSAMLSTIIYAAAWDNKKRPSQLDVDNFLDDPKTDIEKLFDDVTAEMMKANAVKVATKNLKAYMV